MSAIDEGIVKKTGLYFIGNSASKIIMAIIIPFYAYFVSVEELGVFDYSQTIMSTVSPIMFLALWEAILRFLVAEKDEEQRNHVIATSVRIILFIIIMMSATSIIIAFTSSQVAMYTFLMIIVYGAAQVWQYYARALKFNQVYVVSSIIGTILNFTMLILMICVLKMGGKGLFWSYIIGQLSIIVVIEFKIRVLKYLKIGTFQWHLLWQMLRFSLPLVLNLASVFLISGFGRMIITSQLGAYDNGLYSFAMKFGIIISTLGTVISMALIEEAIIKNEEKDIDQYFSNIIQFVFKLFLTMCIFAIPFISIFYHFISNTGYSESYTLVPIFLVYALVMTMSTNVGAIFQARSKTNILFYTTVFGAVTTIILSYLTVNHYGILGVAFAQILGGLTMLLLRWLFAKRLIHFVVRWNKIVALSFIYGLVVFACINGANVMGIVTSVIAMLVVLYLNKDMIIDMKNIKKGNKALEQPVAKDLNS
ncbi:oligosaccharide flippase family protein [Paenibacillus soyae]|uniref:Polysaccharide biosynthesis C-terminal domain-containing protein n=1 Tax=Paenibacillus soyae TaxID=2969249 RepID=A0A9X2MVX4_9BACL|nr:polysaccharide biosynthesis C-terminal domain-containing protein [Paenibacillus soyae]MCR2807400.1 polysaccharide biosynthesis C-terminal domain-containing protein [Paenibacillus soyae]